MKENGLFINPNEFRSDREIKRKLAMNGDLPTLITPLPSAGDFTYWADRFEKRQDEYKEHSPRSDNNISIKFHDDAIINFIGDIHTGNPDSDYKRLRQEIEVICNTPQSYVVLVGDIVDGYFFNPAQFEQIEQTPEQWKYIDSMLRYLAQHKKLLAAWGGDHDQWATKMGCDPYGQFSDKFGAYYMKGVGYIHAECGDNEYKITAAHRMPGFSMYNNVHPQMRNERFGGGAGSDIIVSGHTHKKGHSEQAFQEFGGAAHKVHYISLGPYKPEDDYSRKLGFAKQSPEQMYGCAIRISKDTKHVIYYDDILDANVGVSV